MLGVLCGVGCCRGLGGGPGTASVGSLGYGAACFAPVVAGTKVLIVIPAVTTPA